MKEFLGRQDVASMQAIKSMEFGYSFSRKQNIS